MAKKTPLLLLLCLSALTAKPLSTPPPDKQADNDTTKVEPAWTYKGNASVTLSQVSLTNWVAGGENAYNLNSGMDLAAAYKKGKNAWDSSLKIGFGFIKQETESKRMNSADQIDFSTKYGRNASNKWYYSVLLGFRTQFDQGYKTVKDTIKISDFMSPAYVTLSFGMDYKEKGKFTALMSPLAGKLTIVNSSFLNNQGAFGVDTGKVARMEMGGTVKLEYNTALWKNKISLKNTIEFFSNYLDKPENIDLNWDLTANLKISDYITFKFQIQAIYDDDSRITVKDSNGKIIKSVAKLQVKEFIGFGLAYNFDTNPKTEKPS